MQAKHPQASLRQASRSLTPSGKPKDPLQGPIVSMSERDLCTCRQGGWRLRAVHAHATQVVRRTSGKDTRCETMASYKVWKGPEMGDVRMCE